MDYQRGMEGAILVLLGALTGALIKGAIMEDRCIKHNAAHYDPKTGAFTWNDEAKAEKQP